MVADVFRHLAAFCTNYKPVFKSMSAFCITASKKLLSNSDLQLIVVVSGTATYIITTIIYKYFYKWKRQKAGDTAQITFKALGILSYGGLPSISILDNHLPIPAIQQTNEILIQVKAVAIDQADFKTSQGYGRTLRKYLSWHKQTEEFPVILGRDCSGIVIATGSSVTEFQPGDEVWAIAPPFHQGCMSQLLAIAKEYVAHKPRNLTFEGAATLPYSAAIAWNAIVIQANLGRESIKGKRILVHDGSSEVGALTIQLLKLWGGHVTTTVRSSAVSSVLEYGVNDIIVNDIEDFIKELGKRPKFDVVFNTVGSILHNMCREVCSVDGLVISVFCGQSIIDRYGVIAGVFYALFVRIKNVFVQTIVLGNDCWFSNIEITASPLTEISKLLEANQMSPLMDSVWELEDHKKAFEHAFNNTLRGKVVIKMD